MSSLVTLAQVELRLLTPLFSAGANQNEPELRATALKSALRFWYRAIDPRAVLTDQKGDPRFEDRFFGGGGEGAKQSPVLLRLQTEKSRKFTWQDVNLNRFDEGSGGHRKNGIRYLSYSLHMRPNDERQALAPGSTINLKFQAERRRLGSLGEQGRRAWIAALWLLGNLGSLGTRSRRGLGSIEITNWPSLTLDEWAEDAARLPNLQGANSVQAWTEGFSQAMAIFDRWFEFFGDKKYTHLDFTHPHLGDSMRTALLAEGFKNWEEALNAAGRKLQDFRVRRQPDYDDVKRALQSGQPVTHAPERAAFGLPLTFRYSSLPGPSAEFVPTRHGGQDRTRHASLLFIRLVRLGERYHPLFLRMSGAVPGVNPPADMLFIEQKRLVKREASLGSDQGQLLDEFMASLGRNR